MSRYSHIQKLRNDGKWTVEKGRCHANNFTRQFNAIEKMASVEHREFHDLRADLPDELAERWSQ
jgi:hypothetical protein